MLLFISLIILLPKVQSQWPFYNYGNGLIRCYSCSDCPEPFALIQTTVTPPDTGQCMKIVATLQDVGRRLISKGFSRNCIPDSSQNIRVYCCSHDLCNRSNALPSSMVVTLVSLTITTLLMRSNLWLN